MSESKDLPCLSSMDVARRLGCRQWAIQRVCEKKLFPEPPRVGRQRVFRESDLPAIRKALLEAGYLKEK